MNEDLSVLLVDDEDDFRELAKHFLKKMLDEIHVETVASPLQAIELLKKEEFDIIVSDYQMPDINGIELLRILRNQDNDIPFILFTGHSREKVAIEALNLGANFYLQKGGEWKVIFTELKHFIKTIAEKRESQKKRKLMEDALLSSETALHESEERLRTLVNASPDLIVFKDGNGRWLEANETTLNIFQLDKKSYRGKKDSELAEISSFCKDVFITCEKTDEISWEKRTLSRVDEKIPLPEGGIRIFDVIKIPLFNSDNTRKGIVVLGRDITDRKKEC